MHTPHRAYRWPGAKAPGHQYPQCWPSIYPTHICIIQPWVNLLRPSDTYMHQQSRPSLMQINGLSSGWRQAIIWINAGILLISPLGTNFGEILIKIHISSFKYMHLKLLSGTSHPSCLGLNVLNKHATRWWKSVFILCQSFCSNHKKYRWYLVIKLFNVLGINMIQY